MRRLAELEMQAYFHLLPEKEENNHLFAFGVNIDAKNGTIYTDLTGRFPARLLDGMVKVFVLYGWTTNAILAEPMENAKDETMVRVFKEKLKYLKKEASSPNSI